MAPEEKLIFAIYYNNLLYLFRIFTIKFVQSTDFVSRVINNEIFRKTVTFLCDMFNLIGKVKSLQT